MVSGETEKNVPVDLADKIRDAAMELSGEVRHLDSEYASQFFIRLPAEASAPRLYVSAGIHGDEPAGPLAVLSMLKQEGFFDGVETFVFPVLNPWGLTASQRENEQGVDLNRNFGPTATASSETEWHLQSLKKMSRVDVALCLHEDWEASGVYLYHVESKAARFNSAKVLAAMGSQLPIETSCVIDGSQACHGIISRKESDYVSDDWPESVYLTRTLTRASFTLETPSSAPMGKRVKAHCAAVAEVVRQLKQPQ
jgi:predicted deacylase